LQACGTNASPIQDNYAIATCHTWASLARVSSRSLDLFLENERFPVEDLVFADSALVEPLHLGLPAIHNAKLPRQTYEHGKCSKWKYRQYEYIGEKAQTYASQRKIMLFCSQEVLTGMLSYFHLENIFFSV